MGLSIHYRGSFNPSASLREMIDEVVEVYGVSFTPPSCEPVYLSFLSNGRISTEMHLKFFGNSKDKDYQKYFYAVSTKTQYTGIKNHMFIIHLIKHISAKYLKEFQLIDEGKYWETEDEKLLEAIFKNYNDLLDSVADALEIFQINTEETIEEYVKRVIDQVNRKPKK